LVLLGFLILGGVVLQSQAHDWRPYPVSGGYQIATEFYGPGTGGMSGIGLSSSNTVVAIRFTDHPRLFPQDYWLIGVLAVFLATVVWYGWRSGRTRAFVWVALCGMVAVASFLLIQVIVENNPELGTTIGGSLAAIGICAAAWVYFTLGPGEKVVTAVSVVGLSLGGGILLAGVAPVVSEELIVVSGLLVLAWLERSRLLAVIAVAFFVVAWIFLPGVSGLALSAGVLLLGGIASLLLRKRAVPA
jgi:hypothetical protein